jgi:DNA-binding transcriptional MerR regulator
VRLYDLVQNRQQRQKGAKNMQPAFWKVGELAKQTGVSVRTLHYYDEIGLLRPSHRNGAGYRLYAASDIIRLQQIKSLRQLGFSLEETRDCFDRPDFSPQRVIELHLSLLREEMKLQRKLIDRLQMLLGSLRSMRAVSVEAFIQTIEVISMLEKYYTLEQLKEIKERGQKLGAERIRQAEAEWQELIEQVRAEMEKGTDPASKPVQRLAKRWMGLIQEFTGGNPEIEKSLGKMWQQEQTIHGIETAPMREMGEYISKAIVASK